MSSLIDGMVGVLRSSYINAAKGMAGAVHAMVCKIPQGAEIDKTQDREIGRLRIRENLLLDSVIKGNKYLAAGRVAPPSDQAYTRGIPYTVQRAQQRRPCLNYELVSSRRRLHL